MWTLLIFKFNEFFKANFCLKAIKTQKMIDFYDHHHESGKNNVISNYFYVLYDNIIVFWNCMSQGHFI